MSNGTSFRFPFNLPSDVHPDVAAAIKNTFNGILDAHQAIVALNTKVAGIVAGATTVIQSSTAVASGGSTFPTFGSVNLQPNLTPGAYSLVQTDLGGLILVNSSVAFALTLNSGLTLPYFTSVYNFGTASITATPSAGNVNNLASLILVPGQFATFFMDMHFNWWALVSTSTAGLPVYANNAAAIAGGLSVGNIFRSGGDPDLICVVH